MSSVARSKPLQSDGALPQRRRALRLLVNGALGAISGALGALLGVFALRPAPGSAKERWVRAAMLVELKPDTPVTRVLSVPRADGWYRERVRQTVFLIRDGDDVRALSATCTHLGCQVKWDSDTQTLSMSVSWRRV